MGKLGSLLFIPSYCPFFNEHDVMDALVARMRPSDIVFDIGAYHGTWAMLLSRHAAEVVAFEPQPSTFSVLKEMISVNGARNVKVCCLALGSEPCSADFWGTGSGASLRAGHLRQSHVSVEVDTLDRYVDRLSLMPDVLKIDVEGGEYDVLLGARRCLAHTRLLCIEVHLEELSRFGADYAMMSALLTKSGFVEVVRKRPTRGDAEDASRMHVIMERGSEQRQAG